MIKGIIFDLDGVYFKNGTKNFLDTVSLKFKVDRDKVAQVYLESDKMQEYKKGKISGKEYWNWIIAELEIESTMQELLGILEEGYEINDQAKEILKKIKSKQIKSIMCSNNFKERIELLINKFDFQKDFDYSILSYNYGIIKPELLNKVIEETNFEAKEIILIDNGEEIINSAKEKGFKIILCEDSDKIEDYLNEIGVNI